MQIEYVYNKLVNLVFMTLQDFFYQYINYMITLLS